MTKVTAICQECNKQFEYDMKPGFPRKYCFECGAIKKASFSDMQQPEVVKPATTLIKKAGLKIKRPEQTG